MTVTFLSNKRENLFLTDQSTRRSNYSAVEKINVPKIIIKKKKNQLKARND